MTGWLIFAVIILVLAYIPYWFFLNNYNTIDIDSEKNKFWTPGNITALVIFIILLIAGIGAGILAIFKNVFRVSTIHRELYKMAQRNSNNTNPDNNPKTTSEEYTDDKQKVMSAYKPGKCNQIIVNMQG